MGKIKKPLKKRKSKKRSKNGKTIGELAWKSINLENELKTSKVEVV